MFPPYSNQVSRGTPFDNSTNGFTATQAQAAIEEARDTAPGFARASITCVFNSTISNNQWLGFSDQLPGDAVPIRIPWNCILKEIAVSWKALSVDGQMRFFKNGLVDPGNVVYTETFSNQDDGRVFYPDIPFSAGDLLRGRWIDQGQNPSDMALVYFFLLT
jgi:hypothetical protein